jgi:hypothetical protein
MADEDEPKIAEATGQAVAGSVTGKRIEEAMVQAVLDAYANGIIDPDEIRRLQLEARERVRKGE